MENTKFKHIKNMAIRKWVYRMPFFLLCLSTIVPTLFELVEPEYIKYVVEIIIWIIDVLFFIFTIAVIIKDSIEINKNKDVNINLFHCIWITLIFFLALIWAPIFANIDQLIEVLSFLN
jgi:hypothetical protein